MSALFHSLVALSYVALGAAAAFGLPLLNADIEPMIGLFAGAAILVVGALGHQCVAHGSRGRFIARELSTVSATSEAMQRDLEHACSELHEIKTQFGDHPLGPYGADLEANTRSSNEVLSELRLLRTLFSQLTNKRGAKKKAAPAAVAPLAAKKADAAEAASEYRASYMNLSSSAHQPPDAELVQFPDNQKQGFAASQPLGSNAQDILAITRDALERARVSLFLQPIV